jgi:serine/threonine protein phosphatase PrpC
MKLVKAGHEFAALTTRGLRRPENEDAIALGGELILGEAVEPVKGFLPPGQAAAFIVSDGVGGHAHGARASREVASEFLSDAQELLIERTCIEAVLRSNLRLNQVMLDHPEMIGMAATIAGIAVRDHKVCWFNIGDSRVYRKSPRELVQLSIDDTQSGAGHRSHVLLHSLGGQRSITPVCPHVGTSEGAAEDRYLLCSDGLWGMLSDAVIADILDQQAAADDALRMLLSTTLAAGGLDNISIILVQPSITSS